MIETRVGATAPRFLDVNSATTKLVSAIAPEMLRSVEEGIRAAGFFGTDWSIDRGDFEIRPSMAPSMNCLECAYPLQSGMTCSECGSDNGRHAHIFDIETRCPGSFRRMRRGFRYLLSYAILVLVFAGLTQLFGLIAPNIIAMNAMSRVMGFIVRADMVLGIAYPLLLFLAASWFTARGAWEGHLSQTLIKTCRLLFLLTFVFAILPVVWFLIQVFQWPGAVERWVDNFVSFMNRNGWVIAQIGSYTFMVAQIIFVYLCMRSAHILSASIARGWFRICFFFLLAALILQLPALLLLVADQFGMIDWGVMNSASPPGYVVVLYWISQVRFFVYLGATVLLLMGSLRIIKHMRILIPRQTPLHQGGEAA